MLIRPKLFRLIRTAMKHVSNMDEQKCKNYGIGKQAMYRGEFTTQLFQKSILAIVPASKYYRDPSHWSQEIRNEVQKLVDEGYLTATQIGASTYYKPTNKINTGVNND